MKNNDSLTKLLNQKITMSDLLEEPQLPGKVCSNINSDKPINVAHLNQVLQEIAQEME